MAYVIKNNKPYYSTGSKVFPCSISANSVTVDFENPVDFEEKVTCIYTESEIKQRFGIRIIDTWDALNNKVVKATNKTISSIPSDEQKALEEAEAKAKAEEEEKQKALDEQKALEEAEAKAKAEAKKK